jgi:hypothetical protein
MNWSIFQPSDADVRQLVDDIESKGYGHIKGFIPPSELQRMRSFVLSAITATKGHYAGFIGPEAVAGSGLDALSRSLEFQKLMMRVYELGTGRHAPEINFYQVLRCLTGPDSVVHSMNFHYDTYVVTAMVPIEIPSKGMTGDFIMLPNTRNLRKYYAFNLFDKFLLDNKLAQSALKLRSTMLPRSFVRIKLVPGDLYFFWGYRSIHTNEACDPDQVRATALFHYADPHAESPLKHKLGGHGLRTAAVADETRVVP